MNGLMCPFANGCWCDKAPPPSKKQEPVCVLDVTYSHRTRNGMHCNLSFKTVRVSCSLSQQGTSCRQSFPALNSKKSSRSRLSCPKEEETNILRLNMHQQMHNHNKMYNPRMQRNLIWLSFFVSHSTLVVFLRLISCSGHTCMRLHSTCL